MFLMGERLNTQDTYDNPLFEIDKFDFLKTLPVRAQRAFTTLPLNVTCFDVNRTVFIFGSNIGVIYGFKRGQRKSRGPFLKSRIVTDELTQLKLVSDEFLIASSHSGLYLLNWKSLKFLYGWKYGDNEERSTITCFEYCLNNYRDDQHVIIISGDKKGVIRSHDTMRKECHIIWKEDGDHEIVQMQFIDRTNQTLLISTCFRTFILNLGVNESNPQETIPIGRNSRKQCGKYGATCALSSNTIYASRPSMHIIKADSVNGNVLETFILKNARQPKKLHMFDEFRSVRYSNATLKLGFLLMFCDEEFLISWNDSNLLIVQSNQGQLCVREENLFKILDMKVTNGNDGEAFLLFNNRDLVRIRAKKRIAVEIPVHLNEQESYKDTDDDDDSISIHSTESMLNLLVPINFNEFNYVKDEVKKVFGKIQDNVSLSIDKLSSSIIGILDSNSVASSTSSSSQSEAASTVTNTISGDSFEASSDYSNVGKQNSVIKNSFKDDQDEEPLPLLVIHRKKKGEKLAKNVDISNDDVIVQRKLSKSSLKSSSKDLYNEGSKSMQTKPLIAIDSLSSSSTVTAADFDKDSGNSNSTKEQSNDDEDSLLNILRAYKEAKGVTSLTSLTDHETECNSEVDPLILKAIESSLYGNLNEIPVESNNQKQTDLFESNYSSLNKDTTLDAKPLDLNKMRISVKNFTWEMSLSSVNSLDGSEKLQFLCANGFNCEKSIGLVWLVGKTKANSHSLFYFPGFNELKLSKVKIVHVCASYNSLFVLCHDGIIYRREGIDATKPLGIKWVKLGTNILKHKIVSMSYCMINSLVWCCDEAGDAWILKSKELKWTAVKNSDTSEIRLRKVCVSPNNCSMVWAVDVNNNVYVRQGIFFDDEDDLLMGISWFKVEGLDDVKDIAVCDNAVWVILEGKKLYRRHGINTPDNYVGDSWESVIGPTLIHDSYSAISASANNELWMLTEFGCIYHTHITKANKNDEVDDWLMID